MTPPTAGALHVEVAGTGPPVVLLHGFTQTGRLWGRFGDQLERHHRLVRVDLPGHGGSADVRADLWETAALVEAAARRAVGSAPFAVVGYSLGGRVALHLVLAHPEQVSRAVLVGATGGIDDAEDRARRRARDEATAAELESSGDVDRFLRRWLSSPMFAGLGAAGIDERRRNTPTGLASSLRLTGTGSQEPLWERLATLAVPLAALAGADDPRFVSAARRLAATAPAGVWSMVPGAGHAAHLHQPGVLARLVRSFVG